jgi:hypothetical protein
MGEHAEPRERFTDEEVAFLRHVRFGALPPRILPEDRVELREADAPTPDPADAVERIRWAAG